MQHSSWNAISTIIDKLMKKCGVPLGPIWRDGVSFFLFSPWGQTGSLT
jgi:hypothetical protein